MDNSTKPVDAPINQSIIPTRKKNTNIVHKKYNLRSKPILVDRDDDNDDENDDINVISSSKNVAFTAWMLPLMYKVNFLFYMNYPN